MDTKSQNKVAVFFLFLLSIILFGCSLLTSFEKKLDYDKDTMSYFRDSPEIQELAIRYAKNLQRYYCYYKNFDISTATMKLAELDKYISTGHVDEGKSSHTVIKMTVVQQVLLLMMNIIISQKNYTTLI